MGRTKALREAISKGYWNPIDAQVVVEAFRESGESESAFCRRMALTRQRLRYWLTRVPDAPADALSFAECVLRPVRGGDGRSAIAEEPVRVVVGAVEIRVPVQAGAAYVASLVRELAC